MQQYGTGSVSGPPRGPPVGHYNSGSMSASGPPQLQSLPFQTTNTPPPVIAPQQRDQSPYTESPVSAQVGGNLPPLKPVFGLSLDELFERDGSAVPMVVYQCIQAVDFFGLEVEGIYRLSGTSSHVKRIKAMFDNGEFGVRNLPNRRLMCSDASKVDFRDPANFFHDVNSVTSLLKQFFRDLPDPLLTAEHYPGFIEAASAYHLPVLIFPLTDKVQKMTMISSAETHFMLSLTAFRTPTMPLFER